MPDCETEFLLMEAAYVAALDAEATYNAASAAAYQAETEHAAAQTVLNQAYDDYQTCMGSGPEEAQAGPVAREKRNWKLVDIIRYVERKRSKLP